MLKNTIRTLSRACRGAVAPRRMRRTRGFGVHSPFAFRFIREVLDQPCAYYCYPQIEATCRADGTDPRSAKALFRIALYFSPERPIILGPITDSMRAACKAAGVAPADAGSGAEGSKCIIAFRDELEKCLSIWQSSETGMLFCAPEMAVFVHLAHLPHQRFDILLR